MTRPPLALTMGEPAGIGGEIAVKAWCARDARRIPPFFVIGDSDWLRAAAGPDVPLAEIDAAEAAVAHFATALPVLPCKLAVPAQAGRLNAANGTAVIEAIAHSVALAKAGSIGGVVTNPIHKAALYGAGFSFPGHTEFLSHLSGGAPTVMMLAIEGLRVVPVTVHLPLSAVAGTLTTEAIVRAGTITAAALARDFGVMRPRLAVAALNPHAGESGALGSEEEAVIAPAVAALAASGIAVSGPHPADTLFHPAARARFDAALCMYHDQALIPLKTLDFERGVNVTLGLPFVRTSPDHGTALDIAGKGVASAESLIAALRMADDMAARRAAA